MASRAEGAGRLLPAQGGQMEEVSCLEGGQLYVAEHRVSGNRDMHAAGQCQTRGPLGIAGCRAL